MRKQPTQKSSSSQESLELKTRKTSTGFSISLKATRWLLLLLLAAIWGDPLLCPPVEAAPGGRIEGLPRIAEHYEWTPGLKAYKQAVEALKQLEEPAFGTHQLDVYIGEHQLKTPLSEYLQNYLESDRATKGGPRETTVVRAFRVGLLPSAQVEQALLNSSKNRIRKYPGQIITFMEFHRQLDLTSRNALLVEKNKGTIKHKGYFFSFIVSKVDIIELYSQMDKSTQEFFSLCIGYLAETLLEKQTSFFWFPDTLVA